MGRILDFGGSQQRKWADRDRSLFGSPSLSLSLSLSFAIALSLLVEPRSTPSVKPTLREALEPSDTRVPDSWEKIGKDVEVSKAEVRRRGCFLKAVEERIPGL